MIHTAYPTQRFTYAKATPLRFGEEVHHAHAPHVHDEHCKHDQDVVQVQAAPKKKPSRLWRAITLVPRWFAELFRSGVNLIKWLFGNTPTTNPDNHHDHAPGEACDHPDHDH